MVWVSLNFFHHFYFYFHKIAITKTSNMTLLTLFSCGLIAYSLPVLIFILILAKRSQLVILTLSRWKKKSLWFFILNLIDDMWVLVSAFMWLISLLFFSLFWFMIVPARVLRKKERKKEFFGIFHVKFLFFILFRMKIL